MDDKDFSSFAVVNDDIYFDYTYYDEKFIVFCFFCAYWVDLSAYIFFTFISPYYDSLEVESLNYFLSIYHNIKKI